MSRGDDRVLWLVYGSLLVPFAGPVLLAVWSSATYYRWRTRWPGRAAWLNRHAWIAIGLNLAANLGLLLIVRR